MALTLTLACEEEATVDPPKTTLKGDFSLDIEHVFGSNNFAFNQSFTTGSSEDVTFTKVRYYLSNIVLEKMDGTTWAETESYHLIDASDANSMKIQLEDVPTGEYHKLSYMIGVDSTRNVSGAQDGALSPTNNMFWSWNSGYIFAKIEGTSSVSGTGNIVYHIGGFAGANNAIISKTHDLHNNMLTISPDASPQAHIMVDLKSVFDGMHTVSVAIMPTMTMPGTMAVHLSHNLGAGIELDHIHN